MLLTFDGTEQASHTGSLGRALVHAPPWGLPSSGFPAKGSDPPEADPSLEGPLPTAPAAEQLLRARSPCLRSALRLAAENEQRCVRPTAASHYLNDEHPCIGGYRRLFEARASPLGGGPAPATRRPVSLAFHDAEPASARSSRLGPACSAVPP